MQDNLEHVAREMDGCEAKHEVRTAVRHGKPVVLTLLAVLWRNLRGA